MRYALSLVVLGLVLMGCDGHSSGPTGPTPQTLFGAVEAACAKQPGQCQ